MDKELRRLLDACDDQNFQCKRTAKGHWMISDENGRPVTTMSGTPSVSRSWKNGLAQLRRAGFVWLPARR